MAGAVPDSVDTPLMRQYLEVKDRYPDCIVFFRLGDFYEMFFDDAVVVARALDLTLTSRDKGKENPIPMCGVPHHSSRHYLGKLVELGFRVAICEQVEDPKVARGIVKREVVRVVTPGVVLDEEHLDAKAPNYLAAAIVEADRAGVAYLDVTTGEFAASDLPSSELTDELARLAPREVLTSGVDVTRMKTRVRATLTSVPAAAPETVEAARKLLGDMLRRAPDLAGTDLSAAGAAARAQTDLSAAGAAARAQTDLSGAGAAARAQADLSGAGAAGPLGTQFSALALRAAAAVLTYAQETQPRGKLPITSLKAYRAADHLILDESTRTNLELFATIQGGKKIGSLLGVLDETRTSMGGRLLRRFLAAPLVEVARIRRRHDAVAWLVEHAALRAELRAGLAEIYDLERLAGRATLGVASPRDMSALARSLERLPEVRARLVESFAARDAALDHPELLDLSEDLAADVAVAIRRVLVDDPPAQWREGGFCRRGYSAELDELLDLAEGGKSKIAEIETRERERTGIASLKIRYNRVFGYYLEITRSNLDRVPSDYVRKQTLANAERYVTPELAEYEAKILHADEKRLVFELDAFERLRVEVASAAPRLLALAEAVALLDTLAALAEVAHVSGYCRPEVDEGLVLDIEDGRHPVVEKLAADGKFVPNDLRLDPDDAQLVIVTGPNMAGKSTVMRQVALISLMAQMGGFVPAKRARLGVVDRIFTRVGASDNLARGDSTFMVEMRETAHILHHATRRSLVVLDEIGRGTSTYDGMAIAWAVAEHLHDRIGCKTLFATHYHELTALERSHARVRNVSTAVREWKHDIVFLHKLQPGGASRSYGIQVARLAGLDRLVIARARELVARLERGETVGAQPAAAPQLSLLESTPPVSRSPVEELLAQVDIDGISPREALAILADLQARVIPSKS